MATDTRAKLFLIFLLAITFCLFIEGYCQTDENYYVRWNAKNRLKCSSYKVFKNVDSVDAFASSHVDVYRDFNFDNDIVNYTVFAYFDIYSSYIVDTSSIVSSKSFILKHEQVHFDICELSARKMKQYLVLNACRCQYETIHKALDSLDAEINEMHNKFDFETGGNDAELDKWKKKIDREILLLEKYKNSTGHLKCK